MLARKFMTPPTQSALCIIGVVFVLCLALMFLNNNTYENFEDPMTQFEQDIAGLDEAKRKSLLASIRERLVHYGLIPETGEPQVDRTQWVPKSNIPPAGPRIDMSQYVHKSSIPPEKVCPPPKEIDLTQYVKKSTLPPAQQCPPHISPKIQVSAGLCSKCPECPKCPPPQRCPEVTCPPPTKCPLPPKCPEVKCPPEKECPKCDRIKYIKVPTVITRTVYVDNNGNVVSENVGKESTASSSSKRSAPPTAPTVVEENMTINKAEREKNECESSNCQAVGLNSAFREYGVYGF